MNGVVEYNTSTFSEKLFHYGSRICIIVPSNIEFWDNFNMGPYAEYIRAKMIHRLKTLNLN